MLLIGLPASGKSSFYDSHLSAYPRISKDLLKNNRRKDRRQKNLLEEAFERGESGVVLDNTHPSKASREPWIQWARERGLKIVGYYLGASVEECKARNSQRKDEHRVPDVGFFSILRDLERPSLNEGFDELYFVKCEGGNTEIEEWREE